MKKRLLSILLAVLLIVSAVSLAYAEALPEDVTAYGAFYTKTPDADGNQQINRYLYLTLNERYTAVTGTLSATVTEVSYETYETTDVAIDRSDISAERNEVVIDGTQQTRLQLIIKYDNPAQVRTLRIAANSLTDAAGKHNREIVLEGEPYFYYYSVGGTGHSQILGGEYEIFSMLAGTLAGDGDTIDLVTSMAPTPFTILLDGELLCEVPANCEKTVSFTASGAGGHELTLMRGDEVCESYPFEVLSQRDVYRGALQSAWSEAATSPFLLLAAVLLWWVPYLGPAAVLGSPIYAALSAGNILSLLFRGIQLIKYR